MVYIETHYVSSRCGSPSAESPVLSQQRHRHHVTECLHQLNAFAEHFLPTDQQADVAHDLAIGAHQLRLALRSIGQITGEVSTEDVLDVIFRDFCIGK